MAGLTLLTGLHPQRLTRQTSLGEKADVFGLADHPRDFGGVVVAHLSHQPIEGSGLEKFHDGRADCAALAHELEIDVGSGQFPVEKPGRFEFADQITHARRRIEFDKDPVIRRAGVGFGRHCVVDEPAALAQPHAFQRPYDIGHLFLRRLFGRHVEERAAAELELHLGWLREHNDTVVGLKEYLQGQLPRVKSLEAQLKRAEFDLQETTVCAPSKGYASNLQLTPGAFATAGAPLLSFVDAEQTWVVAIVTENGLGLVKPGDTVEVTTALYPGKVFNGQVESVVWGVGQAQGTPSGTLPNVTKTERTQKYMVRLRLDDEAAAAPLRQGSTAVAAIYTEHGRMLHIIRKVQIRIQSILNYLYN